MMVNMQIQLDDQVLHVDVQYGNRKKISIHIDATGYTTVKVPKGTTEDVIASVIQLHGTLIMGKLHTIEKARAISKLRTYEDDGKFLYLGKEYFLHELIETGELDEGTLKKNLKKFYFLQCKKIVEERMPIYQALLKVKAKSFEVEESRTKWGSCSSDKKLTFNYRLAMAPMEVIDYVIIHELCHLTHMNHDRSFWRRVGSVMPDYKEKQSYLERNGRMMTL
jgi:predicted metal-dependent hydrolase